jgi:hypothetical protein
VVNEGFHVDLQFSFEGESPRCRLAAGALEVAGVGLADRGGRPRCDLA